MSTTQAATIDESQPQSPASAKAPSSIKPARLFYSGAAFILLLLMFFGFQQFYLHGKAFPDRPLTPPIRTIVIAHGVSMTLWMFLFMAQPLLIATRKTRVHMTVGIFGTALAACMVVLGILVGIGAARVNPPDALLWGLNPHQFLAIPLSAIFTFAVFVTIGILNRKKSAIHRPMMLLSVLAIIPAALDRIPAIPKLYEHTVFGPLFGPFFASLVIGLVFLVVKWALTRQWDKWYAMGFGALVIVGAITMQLAPSGLWEHMTAFLFR